MRPPLRLLALALVVGLVAAGSAQAAVVGVPQFSLSPYTKAQLVGDGTFVSFTFVWLPPTFAPQTPDDKQTLVFLDLENPSQAVESTQGRDRSSLTLVLRNGHRYEITVAACQLDGFCDVNSPHTTGTPTRIDATPPAGTMQINGGAAATNNRTVTLNLVASDPLIGGVPDTSSGITQVAADVDGDGSTPCLIVIGSPSDTSGCAVPVAPSIQATIPAGPDGVKTLGVVYGDGARDNTRPCPTIFCAAVPGSPILGNPSAPATDTILLDTGKPSGIVDQDRFVVGRGDAVRLSATGSVDQNPAAASGVDAATATWQFKDGTPMATGASVSHVFNRVGTFVGEMRVRDRAGNQSDQRSFAVTVRPEATVAGGGGILRGITGTAAFSLDRMRVRARFVRSRLVGSIILSGRSTLAGALRAELRRSARGRVAGRAVARRLAVGAFIRTLKLPATLLPGTYRVALVGPGGTLRTALTLLAPREGVIRSGRVRVSGGGASVLFRLAAQPVRALRGRLTVVWLQGSRRLASVPVGSGRSIRAALPGGAGLGAGRLRAQLRAGGTVVGSAAALVREFSNVGGLEQLRFPGRDAPQAKQAWPGGGP